MKDTLKYIALAIVAYLIYQQFAAHAAAAPGNPAPPSPIPPVPPPAPLNLPPPALGLTTRDLLMNAAGAPAAGLSFHQWNYFYRQVKTGSNPPAPETVGMGDGIASISVDQYLAAIAGAGLSGWRR